MQRNNTVQPMVGSGGWGEGVTLAETATDEKQTSIVLNTKGLKETRTMSQ